MNTYRKKYIVKAKNENSEINSKVYMDANYILKCISIIVFAIIFMYWFINKLENWIWPTVFGVLGVFVVLGIDSYINTWKVFTKNRKLYIRRYFSEEEIDYSCLVTMEVIRKIPTSDEQRLRKIYTYFLVIKYVDHKKEKIKTKKLQVKEELVPEVEKFCQMFMTNIQAEEGYDESFLDVREENSLSDRIINKCEEKELERQEKETKLMRIVIIVGIIIFFMMIASIPIIENMQK